MISAPDYSDYNRGNRADDDSDEQDIDERCDNDDGDHNDPDSDVKTELAPEDADEYCLVSRHPEEPAPRRLSQHQMSDNRRGKMANHRQTGGAESSRSSSFTSVQMTPHPVPGQREEMAEHPPLINADWPSFRGSPSLHMGASNTSPDMYSSNQVWRTAMQVPRPYSEHGMMPPHPMLMTPQPGMIDARFLPVQQHGFPNGPASQFSRHVEYPPGVDDSRGMPMRTATAQGYCMGPPPLSNHW